MPRNPFLDQVPAQEFPLTSYYLQSKLKEASISASYAERASYAESASYAGTASFALTASFVDTASTNAFVQGGNSFGTQATLGTNDNQSLVFKTSGSTRMFISSSGNVLIGTTTDGGYKLDINGIGRFQNTLTVNAVGDSIVINSGAFVLQSTSGIINYRGTNPNTAGYAHNFTHLTSMNQTSGQYGFVRLNYTFNPTSGTSINNSFAILPTINQTGGANGTTRGLYIQPTLTSAADFRAIENTVGNNLLNSTSGNTYIGLSSNTGSARLQVRGSGATSATTALRVENTNATASLEVYDSNKIDIYRGTNSTIGYEGIFIYGPFTSQFGANTSNKGIITFLQQEINGSIYSGIQAANLNYGNVRAGVYFVGGNSIRFVANSTLSPNDRNMLFSSNGNFSIGSLVDAGHRLDVSGSGRITNGLTVTGSTALVNGQTTIKGSGATSATTALRVENSNASASLVVLDNGNVGIGGEAETSPAYKLRVHGGLWASSFEQLQVLNGAAGVGVIRFYNGGSSLRLRVYGPHPSEAVKGVLSLDRQDLNYTTLDNSIPHSASFFMDHPSFVIRSNNTSADSFYLQNYMFASGALFVTNQPAGGDTSFRFRPSASITGSTDVFVINTGGAQVTGSLNVTQGITGSLFGTASWATSALTSSYLNTLNQDLTFNGNLTLNGTASISTLVVNQTQYSSGSNQLGDAIDDTQTLFGSVIIPTGSLTVTGSVTLTSIFNKTDTSGNSLFLINNDGSTSIKSNADGIFLIKNQSDIPLFTVSQSGIIVLSTQSVELTGSAPNGGIYFTSQSLYIGLD